MKRMLFLMLLIFTWVTNIQGADKRLPALEGLKEMPVKLAADFTEHEGLASPGYPGMFPDGTIFFCDVKLKTLFKTHLAGRELTPVGKEGEGPREYARYILDMRVKGNHIFLLDGKQKVLCLDKSGKFLWETRLTIAVDAMAGMQGDKIFFTSRGRNDPRDIFKALYGWERNQEPRLVAEYPMDVVRTDAVINGRRVKGAGRFAISQPEFLVLDDRVVSTDGPAYTFKIETVTKGKKLVKTVAYDEPYLPPAFGSKKNPAQIEKMFESKSRLYIVSRKKKDKKPRVDIFTLDGQYEASYLIPIKVTGMALPFKISGGYLFYTNRLEDVGFKAFSI